MISRPFKYLVILVIKCIFTQIDKWSNVYLHTWSFPVLIFHSNYYKWIKMKKFNSWQVVKQSLTLCKVKCKNIINLFFIYKK
ncbi:hypothetical protein Glove_431g31 [Diversispora epigaea]|uniref:Uncharacterized protein n=1 Tax=Diversispora epigaea TaxID=1348612 RepID=A0A397GX80_9GLOM|nr:hypothetical protein Glove_431g31 [Diversispora epigaea]